MLSNVNATKARIFWEELDKSNIYEENAIEPINMFRRSASFKRASRTPFYNDTNIWNNIYGTIRDRKRGRARSVSTSTSSKKSTHSLQLDDLNSKLVDPCENFPTGIVHKMSEETYHTTNSEATADSETSVKRYETKCYFKFKTSANWFKTTLILPESADPTYVERVYLQSKIVPFRTIESVNITKSAVDEPRYISTMEIRRDTATDQYISLQPYEKQNYFSCYVFLPSAHPTASEC